MAYRKLESGFKLVKIAERKKRGDQVTLDASYYYSPSHISNVLNGRRNNDSILNEMYRKVYRRDKAVA